MLAPLAVLAVAPAWAQQQRQEARDYNGDGHLDRLTIQRDGGSGYWWRQRCVRDGLTQRRACSTVTASAYGLFQGLDEPRPAKPLSPGMMSWLQSPVCVAANAQDPAQAAMWVLTKPEPSGETVTLQPSAPAAAGEPLASRGVCLSHAQAQSFRGAFSWDAQGNAKKQAQPGRTIFFPPSKAPQKVLSVRHWRVYAMRGAVAIHDTRSDRHQWLASFADGSDEGFKIDRWKRLRAFEETQSGFRFRVRRSGRDSVVNVTLP